MPKRLSLAKTKTKEKKADKAKQRGNISLLGLLGIAILLTISIMATYYIPRVEQTIDYVAPAHYKIQNESFVYKPKVLGVTLNESNYYAFDIYQLHDLIEHYQKF